ncbi:MAG: non-canonical purine NTP pyrophosphatase [Planctomycetota bacterium]
MKNIFIVIGTKNKHKIKEILAIWRQFNQNTPPRQRRVCPATAGHRVAILRCSEATEWRKTARKRLHPIIRFLPLSSFPDIPAVKENGLTYSENAAKKALIWAKNTGYLTLAEDSGIEVRALKWQPGRYSARYAYMNKTKNAPHKNNNRKLLNKLQGLPMSKRTARYRCSAVLASPQGKIIAKSEGICWGKIAFKSMGKNGFGYDPVFIPRHKTIGSNQLTFGQLPIKLKHSISHRGKALRKIFQRLPQILDTLYKKPYSIKNKYNND